MSAHEVLIKNGTRAEEQSFYSTYEPINILGVIFDVFVEL